MERGGRGRGEKKGPERKKERGKECIQGGGGDRRTKEGEISRGKKGGEGDKGRKRWSRRKSITYIGRITFCVVLLYEILHMDIGQSE
jgi:hypothetical protein